MALELAHGDLELSLAHTSNFMVPPLPASPLLPHEREIQCSIRHNESQIISKPSDLPLPFAN